MLMEALFILGTTGEQKNYAEWKKPGRKRTYCMISLCRMQIDI